jgi:hypothetical protein
MRSLWPADSKVVAQYVQPGDAYSLFGASVPGQAIHGFYLVDGASWTVVARLETALP